MTEIHDRFVIGRGGFVGDQYPDHIERARTVGYRGWEFGSEPDHSPLPPTPGMLTIGRLSGDQRSRIRRAFEQFDFVSSHAPFWHNEGVSLLYANRALREASIEALEQTIDFAADLGAHAVGIHLGRSWLRPDQVGEVLRDGLGAVLNRADCCGVTIAVENVPGEMTFSLDRLGELVTDFAHPRLKILLDTGHVTLPPSPAEPPPADPTGMIADFIHAHADDIVQMHLHDNDGAGDRHWPVGRGVLDWSRIAQAIVDSRTPAALILESGEPDEARRALEEYLREAAGRED
ncbi:hypothetical protein AMK68_03515 [candidate division KD3-62 bacterium DG_56]|uniref:Xylose isomerase-like TIM barrel domain-containing protein n=1 Tax=candidate division KD3-62 bacterium DG_56 TaxID=1704032 RepID=A0A0S7XNH6_9BACT|nr:MAG: hypothetical protein AMK68_03515 [candidate division KD3-62 bacterium DG_56]